MSDVTKTPREELECKKKYLYEYSMFFECNDGSKCQILEDDVVRLLNEQSDTIEGLILDRNRQEEKLDIARRNLSKQLEKINEQQSTIQSPKEENEKLRNIHLSIDLTYSYGYGGYLADVRVIDNE